MKMKKVFLFLLLAVICVSLASCSLSGDTENLPKGHAEIVTYERPYTGTYSQCIQRIEDVDFEYVTSNLVKISNNDGTYTYIDSSRIIYIKTAEQ